MNAEQRLSRRLLLRTVGVGLGAVAVGSDGVAASSRQQGHDQTWPRPRPFPRPTSTHRGLVRYRRDRGTCHWHWNLRTRRWVRHCHRGGQYRHPVQRSGEDPNSLQWVGCRQRPDYHVHGGPGRRRRLIYHIHRRGCRPHDHQWGRIVPVRDRPGQRRGVPPVRRPRGGDRYGRSQTR